MNDVRTRVREAQQEVKDQGADVAIGGGWYHDNPHAEDTPNHQLWILGFDEGREVLKRTAAAMKKFKS